MQTTIFDDLNMCSLSLFVILWLFKPWKIGQSPEDYYYYTLIYLYWLNFWFEFNFYDLTHLNKNYNSHNDIFTIVFYQSVICQFIIIHCNLWK